MASPDPEADSIPSEPAVEAELALDLPREGGRFELRVELALARGTLVLVGPSGAGKTLTLQLVAGLLRPDRGRIRIAGELLCDTETRVDVPAHRRGIGYVPQHQSLLPFLDVARNVAFGLPRGERRRASARVRELLDEFGLRELATDRPASLSGGERQRVALARALATRPRLLLLDEPFASIDADGHRELRERLREFGTRHSVPTLLVTHDPADAEQLADEVVRIERGRSSRAG